MLFKLAVRNVRRQMGNYLIYFITVSLTVSLLFAVNNIIFGRELKAIAETMEEMSSGLTGIIVFISLIVAFVLSYATSFMLRLRKREFGTYLTLGITRRNIITLFVAETMIICIFALALGMVFGLFIYQGLMAVMMNLLEMEFAVSSYSVSGILFTVVLVIGIFVVSSLASALYLKRTSINELIHGEKKVEKSVRHPALWFAVTVISGIVFLAGIFVFNHYAVSILTDGSSGGGFMITLVVLAASIVIFHTGLAKSLIYILMKRKKFCCRGGNTFVLRQLSGTLSSNSVMIGFLAFLLTFSVVLSNISFVERAMLETALDRNAPFDLIYTADAGDDVRIPQEEAEKTIGKYTEILDILPYGLYTSGRYDFHSHTRFSGEGYDGLTDYFMPLSEFNSLCRLSGSEPLTLGADGYFIVSNMPEIENSDVKSVVFEWAGKTYRSKGSSLQYPMFSYVYFYVVVPDEAITGMEKIIECIAYDVADGSYDASALREELSYKYVTDSGYEYSRCDYRIREYSRQYQNAQSAILVVGALFVSAIFLLMAMAMLALKTLSGISDDKTRYAVLYRLGMGERTQGKTLFWQTFAFFVMPFAVSILTSIPTAIITNNIVSVNGMTSLTAQIYAIAAIIAAVFTAVYLLYYLATYIIAKRAVICCES